MNAPRYRPNCHCAAYRFPHRASGGACPANVELPQDLCSSCGFPANSIKVDFGIGAHEYWGSRGRHRDVRTVSECCEADLLDNRPGRYQEHRAERLRMRAAVLGTPTPSPTTTGVSK